MLDKAEYSAFQPTLNSSIVSYRITAIIHDANSYGVNAGSLCVYSKNRPTAQGLLELLEMKTKQFGNC